MKAKKGFILLITIIFLSAVISGCGSKPATSPQSNQVQNEAQVIKWTLATSWPAGLLLQDMAVRFAEEVKIASGGRLVIDVHPGGAIVGPLEILDAASAGTIDAFHSTPTYWMGKAPAASLFTSVPMGFETAMYLSWLYDHGGLEMWQKVYDEAGFGLKVLPVGITHPELFAHSHKPIESLEDFKGLKHRTAAEFAHMLKEVGVSVVTLPGAEVYPSLERRVIDSAEFSTPAVNRQLGFEAITTYFTGPGMHQPSCLFEVSINKNSWNKLPDDLKQVVEIVARSITLSSWSKDLAASMDALEYYESKGNKRLRIDDEAQKEFRVVAWKYLDEKAMEDKMFNEIWSSIKDYYQKFVEYESFMVPIRSKD